MTISKETTVRVRYAETDQMGIVYHANYIVWFEVGRTELFRQLELPYTEFEKQGISLAVIDVRCRYRKAARYDDNLTITTTLEKFTSRQVVFSYKITRQGVVLAEGETVHFFLNKDGRPTDIKKYPIWDKLQESVIGNLN